MNPEHDDNVETLIPKYLAGEASANEEKQVQEWIALHPENEQRFRDAEKIFALTKDHYTRAEKDSDIDIDHEWAQFRRRVEGNKTPLAETRPLFSTWMRVAAALIVLLGAGAAIRYVVFRDRSVVVQTAGATKSMILPDGSHVILNKHSSLRYPTTFGAANRTVALTGEAFFEVVHDSKKPFAADIAGVRITDVGTSFDVQGYDGHRELEVTVKEGAVDVSAPGADKLSLAAGQRGVYTKNNHKLIRSTTTDPNFLAWETQKIIFTENDLGTVVETLNRTYGCRITLAAGVPSTCLLTVSFDHQTLEAVLHVLSTTLNLTYKINGDSIEITHAGC